MLGRSSVKRGDPGTHSILRTKSQIWATTSGIDGIIRRLSLRAAWPSVRFARTPYASPPHRHNLMWASCDVPYDGSPPSLFQQCSVQVLPDLLGSGPKIA